MTFTVVSKKEITTDKVLKKVEKFLKNARKGMDEPQTHRMNDDVRAFVCVFVLFCNISRQYSPRSEPRMLSCNLMCDASSRWLIA